MPILDKQKYGTSPFQKTQDESLLANIRHTLERGIKLGVLKSRSEIEYMQSVVGPPEFLLRVREYLLHNTT